MRGWRDVTPSDIARLQARGRGESVVQAPPKRSKYRNVKTEVDGLLFDSRREAEYWMLLRARQDLGEIRELRRQVDFPLLCPVALAAPGVNAQVSTYIADFTYVDARDGSRHVVDAKGHKTREYLLKRKWLELQTNIVIEEV